MSKVKMISKGQPATHLQVHGQFFRVEKYAVQAPRGKGGSNIFNIAAEAARVHGFCDHVESPEAPNVIYGVNPILAAEIAREWTKRQAGTFFHKPSQTIKKRKFRDDRPSAMVGVISTPAHWRPGPMWLKFCEACRIWLKKRFDDRLRSIVEHRDERCLHLHFWVVPREDEPFSAIHVGVKAIEDVGQNAAKTIRDAAYKAAMKKLLDSFYEDVGQAFGLERATVRVKRVTRPEWKQRKFLQEQMELETQRRIDEAVQIAIQQTKDFLSKETELIEVGPEPLKASTSWPRQVHR